MSEDSNNAKPEVYQEQSGFPPVIQLLQDQNSALKNGFENTIKSFKSFEGDAKTIKELLQSALYTSKSSNTETESIERDKLNTGRQLSVVTFDLTKQSAGLLKVIERLTRVIESQNKEIKNVTPGYTDYRQTPNQLNKFFPGYINRTLNKFQDQDSKRIQTTYPVEVLDKKGTDRKDKVTQSTDKVTNQSTALVPASNISSVVVAPNERKNGDPETNVERALTQTSIPELLNEPEERTIKVELVEINDKAIDKLKDMFEKIVGKKAGVGAEEADGLAGIAKLSQLIKDSKIGSVLAKGAGALVKGGGKVIGKTGKLLTNTAKGGGMLYKAGMALRKTGGQIASKGIAMAATKAAEKAATTTATKTATTAAAKTAATTSAKTVGKSILKKLPVIGALAGGVFAVQRAMAGDFAGAGMEAASGALSLLPGLGTAASIGIDAALIGRDVYKAKKEAEVEGTPGLKEATKPLSSVEEKPSVTAESALNKSAETGFITGPKEAEPVITPAAIGPASTIAAPPANMAVPPATQSTTELTDKISSLVNILLAKEKQTTTNNIGSSNANTTVINNNIQSSDNEDTVTSLRIETSNFLSDRRRLA